MARKPLSKRLRFEVFKRDKFTCQYCGRRPPEVMLQADHVVAVAEGGSDEMANLVTACQSCNIGKSSKSLEDVAPALDEMDRLEAMQEMLERRSVLRQEIRIAKAKEATESQAIELVRDWWITETGLEDEFQVASVRMFLKRLSLSDLRDCVAAAVYLLDKKPHYPETWPGKTWKYFCGAAWKKIKTSEAE